MCPAGLGDGNSSQHAAFTTNYASLLGSVLSVPAGQVQLHSLQTSAAAPAPSRRRLLQSEVCSHFTV